MLMSLADRKKALLDKISRDVTNKGKKTFAGKRAMDLSKYPSIPVFDIKNGKEIDKGVYICTIDILPWIVQTDKHPDKETPVGYDSYVLPYYRHINIGPNNDEILCLKRTYGIIDSICIEYKNLWESGNKDEAKKLMPSYRVAYNIIDCNNPELGIQFFLTSGKNFHVVLMTEIGLFEKKIGKSVPIFDIESGNHIQFRATETRFGDFTYFKFSDFVFLEREPYKEDIYDKTIALEEMLVVLNYEEIDNLFHGKERETEKNSEISVNNEDKPLTEERKKKTEEIEKSTVIADMSVSELKKLIRSEKMEISIKQDSTKEELINAINLYKTKNECPYGHVFGLDVDNYEDHCAICNIYEDCANKYDQNKKAELPF